MHSLRSALTAFRAGLLILDRKAKGKGKDLFLSRVSPLRLAGTKGAGQVGDGLLYCHTLQRFDKSFGIGRPTLSIAVRSKRERSQCARQETADLRWPGGLPHEAGPGGPARLWKAAPQDFFVPGPKDPFRISHVAVMHWTLITSTTTKGRLNMPMKNPPHPGGFVPRQCIEPLGLTITDAAAALGVTRTTLSELVNEKRGISPEMAVRLSKVFGGSAESWLTQQAHYDLAQVRGDRIKLKRLEPA